ncbi:hypothetical protein IAQ61_000113 [Plenodomus lingam]|uniref:uncharacterized protein n=1 Tax=Leptosphaeria maculans TaxID=5022 RepID=UPI0033268D22|nr:hypothetical protein IAQ61_000113 [Plenodomus lingam]
MLRTLELGRAVLGSAAPHLELWLTTSITLLIPQPNTTLQQMDTASLFHLLSSGHVWAARGHDMHLIFEPTLGEEPLAANHLQRLTMCLLQAPLWDQLLLDPQPSHSTVAPPGTIRLSLGQMSYEEANAGQKRQQSPNQLPVAHVRPPEGVATVTLEAICVSMSVLEPRQSTRPTGKRSKLHVDKLMTRNEDLKRRRLTTSYNLHPATQDHHITLPEGINEALANSAKDEPGLQETKGSCNAALIEDLIQGAMRIVISGSLGKWANGLKVKANTIHQSLSEIAPLLWQPGFAQGLSQRSHLSRIISRSMIEMICMRSTPSSSSLSAKLGLLTANIQTETSRAKDRMNIGPKRGDDGCSAALSGQIWIHMLKILSNRPVTPLLPGIWSTTRRKYHSADDQILLLDTPSLLAADLAPVLEELGPYRSGDAYERASTNEGNQDDLFAAANE